MKKISFNTDSIFSHNKFFKLYKDLGDACVALGALVLAWEAVQRQHQKTKRRSSIIPQNEWNRIEYGAQIVACGLARITPEGIEVCDRNLAFKSEGKGI